ncbi:hypothetical protein WA588_004231 [Blastocystis sp. NMH]
MTSAPKLNIEPLFREFMNGSTVDCSGKYIGDKGLASLLTSVVNANEDSVITVLNLSDSNLTCEGVRVFAKYYTDHFDHLEQLILSNNHIGNLGIEILYDAMKSRLRLKKACFSKLDISGCDITTDGAHTLHRMIRKTYGNLEVVFSNNQINGEGVGYLYSAKYWESFTIDNNTLDVTFLFFAKHVKSHSYMVKELRILNNNLSPSTILQLPSIFSSFALPSLRKLYIGERIRDPGIIALFDDALLPTFQNLEELSLVGTYLCGSFT